jgi:hypothetical protein
MDGYGWMDGCFHGSIKVQELITQMDDMVCFNLQEGQGNQVAPFHPHCQLMQQSWHHSQHYNATAVQAW